VDIRLAVSAVEKIERPDDREREEQATLEYLKTVKPAPTRLPEPDSMRISLIHPISERARVQDDFLQQLSSVRNLVQLEQIPVAINKPEEIEAGIRKATGNVIVLIRGGGDSADFDVFDQKSVIDAWAGKDAFKALGLGHEGTGGTLLHFISHYAGSTPTAVGGFLARQIAAMDQEKQALENERRQRESMKTEMEALRSELSRAGETRALAIQQSAAAAKRQRDKLLIVSAFLMGILFVLGMFFGYRLAH